MTHYDKLAKAIDEFREAFRKELDEVIRMIKADNETKADK